MIVRWQNGSWVPREPESGDTIECGAPLYLEPVGIDHDGTVKPVAELGYDPPAEPVIITTTAP